jgi:hypothetical protein
MKSDLARDTLRGLLSLDSAVGQIMEIVKDMEESQRKAVLKSCCGTLLRVQFQLMEAILAAHPEFRNDIDPGEQLR